MKENKRHSSIPRKTSHVVADRLRKTISNSKTSYRLGNAAQLSRHLGVSTKTILQALKILRDEGWVDFGRGKPIWVTVGGKDSQFEKQILKPETQNSRDHLFETLAHQIKSGEFKEGNFLPKVKTLTTTNHLSASTVVEAYTMLINEGLAHRKGRAYVVGQPKPDQIPVHKKQEVILIIQLESDYWRSIWNNPWTRSFIETFMTQAMAHGVQTQTVVAPLLPPKSNPFNIISGIRKIKDTIKLLGDRYRGSLLLGINLPYATKTGMDISQWVSQLSQFHKPVVWYDHSNAAGPDSPYPAVQMVQRIRANKPAWKYFCRCHPDERKAVHHTLHLLREYGHEQIAYPDNLSNLRKREKWRITRRNVFRKMLQKDFPGMMLYETKDVPSLPFLKSGLTLKHITDWLDKQDHPYAKRIQAHITKLETETEMGKTSKELKSLIQTTMTLAPFIMKKGITAIVAPNDQMAFGYYHWLTAMEIRIPEEISLVSFDNRPDLTFSYQISSISFGMDYLGFQAFHRIFRNTACSKGSIPGSVSFNHQASIGPAPS